MGYTVDLKLFFFISLKVSLPVGLYSKDSSRLSLVNANLTSPSKVAYHFLISPGFFEMSFSVFVYKSISYKSEAEESFCQMVDNSCESLGLRLTHLSLSFEGCNKKSCFSVFTSAIIILKLSSLDCVFEKTIWSASAQK